MDTTLNLFTEKFNQRAEFLTKMWVWIILLTIFGLITISQEQSTTDLKKVYELFELLPEGYFKDPTELKVYIQDTSKLIEVFELLPIGTFKNTEEYLTYFDNTFGFSISNNAGGRQINIPFIDFPVPASYFATIFLLIISGLTIRWIETLLRLILFRLKVIEPIIKNKSETYIDNHKFETRTIFDGLVNPASTSIWSFVPNFKSKNKFILSKCIRVFIYLLLKIFSSLIHYVLPAFIICIAITNLDYKTAYIAMNILSYIALITSIIALITLLVALIFEFLYVGKVIKERLLILEKKTVIKL